MRHGPTPLTVWNREASSRMRSSEAIAASHLVVAVFGKFLLVVRFDQLQLLLGDFRHRVDERAFFEVEYRGGVDVGVVEAHLEVKVCAEGTARMLNRVVEMRANRKRKSGVFAKMTKPGQDLRIDIPAIGVDTVNAVADANLRGIVVNAKTCFVVNKPAVVAQADKRGIFIIALN